MSVTLGVETPGPAASEPLSALRQALLALKPEGDQGLEGLVAHALASVMSRHFRVSRAGRQHGRDGATTAGLFDVFFETKLYGGKPPSSEDLQAKLMSAIDDHHPHLDVWAVAVTTALGENSEKDVRRIGDRFGVTVVIFDWSAHILPPLAVLLASARNDVVDWLRQHQPSSAATIERMLDLVAGHPSFAAESAELLAALDAETTGLGAARAKNIAWLREHFANRTKARQTFGQFIAPDDPAYVALPRPEAAEAVRQAIGTGGNAIVAVIGDQGHGKTWLVAQAWASTPEPPILLFCTTDSPALDLAQRDPMRFLAQLLLDQTGGERLNEGIERWMRRLENWKVRSEPESRVWLVLDGLNERESLPWVSMIDRIMPIANSLGIRLILTSRPTFFERSVRSRLYGYAVKFVRVSAFTLSEVQAALKHHNQDPGSIPLEILEFIRNPRIFGIAVSMLDRLKVDELRPERLLFEYWRKRLEERVNIRHTDADMRQLLVSHARAVRAGLASSEGRFVASFPRDLWKDHSGLARRISGSTIDDELSEVESGAFFASDGDQATTYSLRPEGFAYALGLLVVDELRAAPPGQVASRMEAALDPIRGYDLVGDILTAAFGIACIDMRCPDAVASVILHGVLGLQNLPDAYADAILVYVTARPAAFIGAAEAQWSKESQGHGRPDWIRWFLFQRRDDARVNPALQTAIRRWLTLWCREPDRYHSSGLSGDELAKEDEHHRGIRERLRDRLEKLTDCEKNFLQDVCTEVDNPRLMAIDGLAVELLAGWPLAPFADALVGWSLCDNLTARIYSADESLSWLLRLNPIDYVATTGALRCALDRLRGEHMSQTALWATIGLLRRTGLPADAREANRLVLQSEHPEWSKSWRRIENFCDTDPLDPSAAHPGNLARAVERVTSIDVASLRKGAWTTIEDSDLRDLTPALARFQSDVVIAKLRAYACDLANRTGETARFLGFGLPAFSAILTSVEIAIIRSAYSAIVQAADLSKSRDDGFGAQNVLLALLPHLSAKEQLDALLELPEDASETLRLRDHFKSLEPDCLARRLLEAEASSVALRRVLFFASSSPKELTAEARDIVQRAFVHHNFVVRLLAFEVAAVTRDPVLLAALARSSWSALDTAAMNTESFYGSKALAQASAEFQSPETLMRMSLGWQTAVVDRWNEACLKQYADILVQQIQNTLALPRDTAPDMAVDQHLETPEQPNRFPYLDAHPAPKRNEDMRDVLRRMSEGEEEFQAQQVRQREAIKAYLQQLKVHGADRLVDAAYIGGLRAIMRRAPQDFEELLSLFRSASAKQLPQLCNIIACAAVAVSDTAPETAAELLMKIAKVAPDITLIIGGAEQPFHRLAYWLGAESGTTSSLRRAAMQSAATDAGLFREALAAGYADKQPELIARAKELAATGHPASVARGLMLAGYADVNHDTMSLFNDDRFQAGFLGQVVAKARYAYERNVWARHWYDKACRADNLDDWWRISELMIRASDGRFVLWYRPNENFRPPHRPFADFAFDRMKKRAKKVFSKREKTLFGLTPPSQDMLDVFGIAD
jgi:hypothetical protein